MTEDELRRELREMHEKQEAQEEHLSELKGAVATLHSVVLAIAGLKNANNETPPEEVRKEAQHRSWVQTTTSIITALSPIIVSLVGGYFLLKAGGIGK